MVPRPLRLWRVLTPVFILAGLGATPSSALAIQIDRASSPVFFLDTGDSLFANYAAYRITNDTGSDIADLWVEAGSFAGPAISLAPNEDGMVRLGALGAGQAIHAYIYLQAASASVGAENHTVSAWDGAPGVGAFLGSAVFGLDAVETIAASSNKVTTVVNGPDPPALGGLITIQVSGETGTIGGSGVFAMSPSGFLNWPADAIQLTGVSVVMSGSANAGTYSDALYHVLPSSANTDFVATYTFRLVGMIPGITQFFPVQYIASGSQIKHTTSVDITQFGPISPPNNHLTLTKSVSTGILAAQDTVTYTVTLHNASPSIDASLDEVFDDLPAAPDLAAYVPGSAAYNGAPIPDPSVSGQTLTFTGNFPVAAQDSSALTYDVAVPGTVGFYSNSATGAVGAESIDLTPSTLDLAPASATVLVTMVEIGAAKEVVAGPVHNSDGTSTFTYRFVIENSGSSDVRDVRLTDDLASAFAGAVGYTVDNVTVTSGPLTANPGFTGAAPDDGLLAGTDSLLAGETGSVELTLTVAPGGNLGPYDNVAAVEGTGLGNVVRSDLTTDGAVPDANGNGDPTDDSTPTPVSFTEAPQLGLAKRVLAGPVSNGDGTYTFTYRFVIENSGDVELQNLQVTDDLSATFGGIGFSVNSLTVSGGPVTANPGYTGTGGGTALLAGSDILPPGQSATVDLVVTVTPGPSLGTYNNSATASGSSPAGVSLNDLSADGSVPDGNGNGDPTDDSTPTPVTLVENAELGAAKQLAGVPINNGDGTYTLTFSLLVENSGDVELRNLQLADDLAAAFGGAVGYTVSSLTVTGGPVTADPGYTGSAPNTALLSGTDTLPAGQTATLDLVVTVTPGANLGPYGNSSSATGTSPGGALLNDLSTDGDVPDGDGNGDPTDDSTPTPVSFTENPVLGTAKDVVSGPTANGDGTFTLTYRILLENSGDVDLGDLQLSDDLAAAFSGATSLTLDNVAVSAGALTLSSGYTGIAPDTDLLEGTDVLGTGQTASVDVTVTVTPGANLGPYDNSAAASGSSPAGAAVNDLSTDGNDPDPDGDGNPGDNSVPTPVTFVEDVEIGLAKRVSAGPVSNGDGTFTLTYTLVVENSGNIPLSGMQLTDDLAATFTGSSGFTVDNLLVSSGPLTPNPAFTGSGANTGLLIGTDVLTAGQGATLDLTITVSPGANLGPYNNSASAEGTSPGLAVATDLSTNGSIPDANGNGDPGDDSASTPVIFIEDVEIGLAKAVVAGPVNNGDGTFTFTYRFTLVNSGDVALSQLQITDSLNSAFPGGVSYTIDNLMTTGGPLTVNPGFTGSGSAANRQMLSGTDILPAGQSSTLELTLTVTPGGNLGPFNNQATAEGRSPAGALDSDISTNGTLPDANGNGDPGDDSIPTPVSFTETPEIGLAKRVSAGPTGNGDGTFTLTYTLLVENSGDVVLNSVQLYEDLAAAFAGAQSFSVDNLSVIGGPLTPNPSFTGIAPDTLLLAGTDNLTLGETSTIAVTVTVDPGFNLGPYVNSAEVQAMSPGLQVVADVSADGPDPDPDGNNDPTDDSIPTSFTIPESPEVGAAKAITAGPASNGDGSFTLTYTLLVENSGDVPLAGLEITEDLAAAFSGAVAFTLDAVTVTGGSLTLDPGFTGTAPNTVLLTGADTLSAGATATVAITVTVDPGFNLGPYSNSFTTRGTSPGSVLLADTSTSGSIPDADGNGDPTDDTIVTSVTFTETPELGLAKRVSAGPTGNGDGTFTFTYTLRVENSGDVPLASLQITDDLAATFAGASGFTVDGVALTSGTVTLSGSYTGSAPDADLLDGTDVLSPGESAEIAVTVTATPGADPGPYDNSAAAGATSPGSMLLSDLSADGSIPDADGNGDPTDDSTPTPVTLVETPEIGLAKALQAGPVNNTDGTYSLTYRFVLENSGDVILNGIQIDDDLATTFAGAQGFSVAGVNVVSGPVTADPGYTGIAPDTGLLSGTDSLSAGGSAVVDLLLTVTPGGLLGPYENRASAEGTSPGAATVTDQSANGSVPDVDGDGDPTNNSSPTVVTFVENAVLRAAKVVPAGLPVNNGDGTHLLAYELTVANLGDVPLTGIQISDDLETAFGDAIGYVIESVLVISGSLTLDPGYTGSAPDTDLLTGTDTLDPGEVAVIELALTVNPGFNPGPYENSAVAAGTPPSGVRLTDLSANAVNNSGLPLDNDSPTQVTFEVEPDLVLLEKHARKSVVVVGEMVQYEITLTNNGAVPLFGISVRDRIPGGFKFVEGTARIIRPGPDGILGTPDDQVNGTVPAGERPLEFVNLSIGGEGSIRLAYTLRVGSGVTLGEYVNEATPYQGVNPIGNTARAPVAVDEDPLLDRTTLLGKVFHDRDGDGWQDPAGATGVTVRGGFATPVYLINSTTIDRGDGPRLLADRGFVSPVVGGLNLGDLPGRTSRHDADNGYRVKLEMILTDPVYSDILIRTDEGTRIRIDAEGRITHHHRGAKARGQTGQDIRVTRMVTTDNELIKLTLIISNEGLEERGIPGVRVASPQGLIVETDAAGRYHLADVDGGRWERGRNALLKVDPATLPPGATFTTENPRLYRVTPSLMGKVNFGVQLPPQLTPRNPGGSDANESEEYAGGPGVSTAGSAPPRGSAAPRWNARTNPDAQETASLSPTLAGVGSAAGPDSLLAWSSTQTVEGKADSAGRTGELPPWQIRLPGSGAVWATVDPVAVTPALNIGAPAVVMMHDGNLDLPVRFTLWSNYDPFIESYEILIFRDTDEALANPVRILGGSGARFEDKVEWDGALADGSRAGAGDVFLYALRAHDASGNVDETRSRTLRFVEDASPGDRIDEREGDESLPLEGGEIHGTNGLARQTIPIRGGLTRVHGTGIGKGVRVLVDGNPVPVGDSGTFATELILPVGHNELTVEAVDPAGGIWRRVLGVQVPESAFFMVGLADLTVGSNSLSGSVEPLAGNENFDDDVEADGRVAFYLKGKIKGKYLLSAQMDTQEEGLDNLFDNIHKKDPRSILRRLDPDRYYPVYGDESTTELDAPSQGKMYARLEWDRSHALWGNYHTGFTGTEFARYNRSLYGAQLAHRSVATNEHGEARSELNAFASEQQTAMGHDEFTGTGGSLYYLSHTDVVQGSEKVWVEIRDRDSQRVLENVALERYRDYEIDDIQGRIILARPLTQVADQVAPSIVRDEPLEGNDVFLLADYEFVPTGFTAGQMSYGVRAKGRPGDHLALGGTFAQETRTDRDYELWGVDGSVRAGRGTYLKAEYAESESQQAASGRFSADGGLTFAELPSAARDTTGAAIGFEGRLDLTELTRGSTEVSAGAWWKRRDAGFSTARLTGEYEQTEFGGEFLWRAGDRLLLSGRAANIEQRDSVLVERDRSMSLQADVDATDRLRISGEARRVEEEDAGSETRTGTLGGLRLGYDLTRNLNVYGIGQGTLAKGGGYEENNLGTVGARAQVRDFLGLRAEGTTGNRGDAVRVGADLSMSQRFQVNLENTSGSLGPQSRFGADWRLSDSHQLYGTYTLNPDRTEGPRSVFTVGQRKSLSNQLRVFTENQFSQSDHRAGVSHVFGLEIEPAPEWTAGASWQSSNLKDVATGKIERHAVSVWGSHRRDGGKAFSKLEYRRDRGLSSRTQWLTTNRVDYRVSPDLAFSGKFNLSLTDDDRDRWEDAQFVETSVGGAYRPVEVDRWQALAKYTFIYDNPSPGQQPLRNDERMHVAAAEGLFDITHRIGVGSKVAARWAETRVDRKVGRWYDTRTYVFVARGQLHVTRAWDALAEYRWLRVEEADDWRHGVQLTGYRTLGENLKAGVGYNFTDFSDDLTRLGYTNHGFFVNVVGMY